MKLHPNVSLTTLNPNSNASGVTGKDGAASAVFLRTKDNVDHFVHQKSELQLNSGITATLWRCYMWPLVTGQQWVVKITQVIYYPGIQYSKLNPDRF